MSKLTQPDTRNPNGNTTKESTRMERLVRPEDRLWTVQDVAYYLGVPVQTLYSWRCTGAGPAGRRVGKYLRYRPADVVTWFDELTDPAA